MKAAQRIKNIATVVMFKMDLLVFIKSEAQNINFRRNDIPQL